MFVALHVSQDVIYAHKQVLEKIPFFATALKKEWREGKGKDMEMSAYDLEALGLYIERVYTGKLHVVDSNQITQWTKLAKVWSLADTFLDHEMKNALIQTAMASTREPPHNDPRNYPGIETINHIFENTPPNDAMQRLLVDLYAQAAMSDWIEKHCEDLPKEFLAKVCTRTWKTWEKKSDWSPDCNSVLYCDAET